MFALFGLSQGDITLVGRAQPSQREVKAGQYRCTCSSTEKDMEVLKQIDKVIQEAQEEIAVSGSLKKLEELRIKYLGRKSEMTSILKGLGNLSKELRPQVGKR